MGTTTYFELFARWRVRKIHFQMSDIYRIVYYRVQCKNGYFKETLSRIGQFTLVIYETFNNYWDYNEGGLLF